MSDCHCKHCETSEEQDEFGSAVCDAGEHLRSRITTLQAKVENLHQGGYPAWAYPNGTCSCKQNPCICHDPMPPVNEMFAELERRLGEGEMAMRFWVREAIGECQCCLRCGATQPCNTWISSHGTECAGACFCGLARETEGET